MKPLSSNEIFGTWATTLLPLKNDDSIDYKRFESSIDTLITSGVNGIYSNGTAGEFYNQTEEEFYKISTLLAKKCSSADLPFQIGCCHTNPVVSLERVKRIKELEPGAIQIIVPDWFPPTIGEIIDYLRVISAAADPIGIVLYNPPHAKKKLTPQDFYEIQKAGLPIVGCKVSGGDEQWYAEMKKLVPTLSLFVPGHHLATGISMGARGSYSNVACINPAVAQQWYQLMIKDYPKAIELQTRIQLFITKCIFPLITNAKYSDPAIDKFLAAITGWSDIGTKLRWPYKSVPLSKLESVRAFCKEIIPEFLEVSYQN
jgi:dihydrodipicolinate synthase/N-acetylneuraminate lyase